MCQTITFSYTKWSLERCMFSPEMFNLRWMLKVVTWGDPSSFSYSNWHHIGASSSPLPWSHITQGRPKTLKNGEIRQNSLFPNHHFWYPLLIVGGCTETRSPPQKWDNQNHKCNLVTPKLTKKIFLSEIAPEVRQFAPEKLPSQRERLVL